MSNHLFNLAIATVITLGIGLILFSQGCIVDLPDTCIMYVPITGISVGNTITKRTCYEINPHDCYDGKLLIRDKYDTDDANSFNMTDCTLFVVKGLDSEQKVENMLKNIPLGQTYKLYKKGDTCYDDNKNIESYTYVGIVVLCICGIMHVCLIHNLYRWFYKRPSVLMPSHVVVHDIEENTTMYDLSDFVAERKIHSHVSQ